jgi:hypothetical protein
MIRGRVSRAEVEPAGGDSPARAERSDRFDHGGGRGLLRGAPVPPYQSRRFTKEHVRGYCHRTGA